MNTLPAALVMFAGLGLPAQAVTDCRLDVTGRVFDRSGQAWGGATVTLIARPIPEYPHIDDVDEVSTVANADGTFTARLLTFRRYSAWAHQRAADGSHRISEIDDDACCGARLELRERTAPQPRLRLQVDGLDKVTQFGRLKHRLLAQAPRNVVVRELVLDDHDQAEIPPLPGTIAFYEILTATQVRLFTTYVPLTDAGRGLLMARKRAGQPTGAHLEIPEQRPELAIVQLPEPTEVTIRVRSAATDRPVAAATIALGAQGSTGSIDDLYEVRPMAKTDDDGVARVPMLLSWAQDGRAQWPRPSLQIWSETHAARFLRSLQGNHDLPRALQGNDAVLQALRGNRDEREPTRDQPTIEMNLAAGAAAVRGRLWSSAGRPAADVPILFYQSRPFVYRTDRSGHFRIPGQPANAAFRLTALIPHPGSTHLAEAYLFAREGTGDGDVGEMRVDELVTVHCRILGADGAPAPGARIYLGERGGGSTRRSPMRVFADVSGHATLRLPRGANLALFAAHDGGFAIEALDVPADRESFALETHVAAATWVSGQVLDEDGTPVPQAHVVARCWQHAHTADWRGRFLDGVCSTTLELSHRRCLSDLDGRFHLPLADTGALLTVTAWKWEDDGTSWQHVPAPTPPVFAEAPIEGVRIVLAKRRPDGGR